MKSVLVLFYSLMVGFNSLAIPTRNINDKLVRTFHETYPNAEQVIWKENPEVYIVDFVDNGIRSSIIYQKDGTFLRATRYYKEGTLPYYLLVNIKRKYPDKRVFGVTEVSTDSKVEYFVKLEGAKVWMTLKMDSDGNLAVVERLRKAS